MSIAARSRYLERDNKDLFCMATLYPIVSPIILNESNQARRAAATFPRLHPAPRPEVPAGLIAAESVATASCSCRGPFCRSAGFSYRLSRKPGFEIATPQRESRYLRGAAFAYCLCPFGCQGGPFAATTGSTAPKSLTVFEALC